MKTTKGIVKKSVPVVTDGESNNSVIPPNGDLKSAMLQMLGPVDPGLYIVGIGDEALLAMVRCVVERQLRFGSQSMGLVLPKKTPVLSVYAGSKRKANEAKVLASAQRPSAKASDHQFRSIGTRDGFAWCSDEGIYALIPIIAENRGWITVAQVIHHDLDLNFMDACSRLRTAAINAGSYLMLFLVANPNARGGRISDFTDGYVAVDKCEREPGAFLTFSAKCSELSDLHPLGIGNSMCSVKIEDSLYSWTWEQFISKTVVDRVIWKLRCEGRSLDYIAKVVRMHKSNVHRHLAALVATRPMVPIRGWLNRYAEILDIETSPQPADSSEAEELGEEDLAI